MTDKLRAAAEMALLAMQDIIHWYSERDENDEVLPPYNQCPEVLEAIQAVEALRQALDQLPDTTKTIDTGIDRGAWSDVPDATKWVDELRGNDEEPPFTDQGVKFTCGDCPQGGCCEVVEPPNSTTHVVEPEKPCGWVNEHGTFSKNLPNDFVYSWRPVYTEPPKPDLLNQTCCGCGRSGGYALYCGECWNKASQWQGLTDEEIHQVHQSVEYNRFMSPYRYAHEVIKESEAKLKEKNGYED